MESTDRARFDGALSKLLYATNGTAKVSPTIAGTYWSILRPFAWPAVAKGMTDALAESTGHVSPATLANFCRPAPADVMQAAGVNRAAALDQRLAAADAAAVRAGEDRFGELWHNAEFQDVRRVANMEFARRINGRMPGGVRIPSGDTYGYHGSFDYMTVVQAAPKPQNRSATKHANCWDYFWQLLREDFTTYYDAL